MLSLILFILVAAIIFGWRIMRATRKLDTTKPGDVSRIDSVPENFKTNSEKIIVLFKDCEIKTNNYSEEREIYRGRVAGLNALGDEMQNTQLVQLYQNVIVFKHQYNGQVEIFTSPVITMESITLKFRLSGQKETSLYVSKQDRTQYMFDLTFLQD